MTKAGKTVQTWVTLTAQTTHPEKIHWCDGSDEERTALVERMLGDKTLLALDPVRHPRSYLHRSDPTDVARTEHLTFICTPERDDAGPTNNWMSREEAHRRVLPLFEGAMRGRTMYVVPYVMGPLGSAMSRVGVQITDSPYVALSLRTMTRMGARALEALGERGDFVRGVHSLGDLSPDRRFIVHFPDALEIWSIGSGYGGNALLSKKCHALRIASAQGRRDGWLAEHMLIVGLTSPEGRKRYIAAAFPSACGKTNLAMLTSSLPGWQVDTIGDDICWIHAHRGLAVAINPENGLFGVAPGTSAKTNPRALAALKHDVIFTNVARRRDGRVWWEGLEELSADETLEDWQGNPWRKGASTPAAHPNSRFTTALRQVPSAMGTFELASGVPLSAIIFGGRRAKVAPLVYEARSWRHGVYVGATMASETTAAATGDVGVLRQDPMAMLPFCGYNMGDYFAHWLAFERNLTLPPRIFHVNWFRTDEAGRFLWPGFGDNVRVLKWILDRVDGRARGRESPIGTLPNTSELDVSGLDMSPARVDELLAVDPKAWLDETKRSTKFLEQFGSRLPQALRREHDALVTRLHHSVH